MKVIPALIRMTITKLRINQTLNYKKYEFSEAQVGASLMQNAWIWVAAARHGRNSKHVARIWQLQHLSMHDIDFSHVAMVAYCLLMLCQIHLDYFETSCHTFSSSLLQLLFLRSCSHWLPQNSCFKLTGNSWNNTHQKWHKGSKGQQGRAKKLKDCAPESSLLLLPLIALESVLACCQSARW